MSRNHAQRNPAAHIEFLYLSAHTVEVRDLSWFCDHWSREASYSRWRRLPPANLLLLESGSTSPELFTVSGGRTAGFVYQDGRRFARCRGTIATAPQHPDDAPARYCFDYWEHDPREDEPPVTDVEKLRFPTAGTPPSRRTPKTPTPRRCRAETIGQVLAICAETISAADSGTFCVTTTLGGNSRGCLIGFTDVLYMS